MGAGARLAAPLRPCLAPARSRRRGGAGRDPRPPGHGLRRARRAPGCHRPLHDHRLPGRVCRVRALEGARARPGLFGVPLDPGHDHTAAGRGRSTERADPRGDVGRARRLDRDRPGCSQAGFRGRPALQRGSGRLSERPGGDDHRGTAPEVVRVLDRRRRVRRGGPNLRAGPRSDQPDDPRHRAVRPGGPAGAARDHEEGPCRAGRRRGRHRGLGGPRPRGTGRFHGGDASPGRAATHTSLDQRLRHPPPARGCGRDNDGFADRHHRHGDELRGPPR